MRADLGRDPWARIGDLDHHLVSTGRARSAMLPPPRIGSAALNTRFVSASRKLEPSASINAHSAYDLVALTPPVRQFCVSFVTRRDAVAGRWRAVRARLSLSRPCSLEAEARWVAAALRVGRACLLPLWRTGTPEDRVSRGARRAACSSILVA
jgi:hypothetical protein